MANQRILRGVTIASFIPGFALCLAHGIASGDILPALGIIPMFFSVVLGMIMLRVTSRDQPLKLKHRARADNDLETHLDPSLDEDDNDELHVRYPILLFFADTSMATLHMVLLVLTWINLGYRYGWFYHTEWTVLGTYGTMPMLADFFIHAYLATRSLLCGTGLINVVQSLFSLGAPHDCPHCGHHIREEPRRAPWFKHLSVPSVVSFREAAPVFVSGAKAAKDWKAPTWMKGAATAEGEALLAEEEGRAQQMYKDDYDDDAVAVRASAPAAEGSAAQ